MHERPTPFLSQTPAHHHHHHHPQLPLEEVRRRIAAFAAERDWQQYHTPRNLLLALVGEVGELSEIFQWRGDAAAGAGLPGFSPAERAHLGEELSDVLLYLVRLSDACGVDLSAAVLAKLEKNAAKYPAERCRGRADKYTAYMELKAEAAARSAGGSGDGDDVVVGGGGGDGAAAAAAPAEGTDG